MEMYGKWWNYGNVWKKTVCYVMKCGNKLVLQWMMQRMGYELDSWTQAFLTQKFLSKCPLMHTTLQWFASIQMFCIYQQCVLCFYRMYNWIHVHMPFRFTHNFVLAFACICQRGYMYIIYIYICNDAYIRTHVIIHLYMNTFADNCIHVSSFLWVSTGHLMPNLLRCTHDASCRHLEKFRTQWGLDSLSRGP